MIIACPECDTKFEIPDAMYSPGRKARCACCSVVFPLPELPASSAAPAPQGQVGTEPSESPAAKKATPPPAPAPAPGGGKIAAIRAFASNKKKLLRIVLVSLAALALVGGLAFGAFKVYAAFFTAAPVPAEASDPAQQERVKNLSLTGMRQYMIPDALAGRIAVVEGKVVNNFSTPKELIKVQVFLYDENGNMLESRDLYCGVVLSLFQLRTLGKADLLKALENRIGVLTNNVNIQPGGEVPFMTVFFDPSEKTRDLGVKIIDVKDPPPSGK